MSTKHAGIFAALAAPFSDDQVRQRQQAGRTLNYVTASTVANRLDDVLGPEGWEFELSPWGDDALFGTLTLKLPDGAVVRKMNVGGAADMPEDDNSAKSAACLPLDAEILTKEGWKTHDQLSLGEAVLAYDVHGGESRWVPLLAVNLYGSPQPVVELSSRSFRMVCTPHHAWAVKRTRRDFAMATPMMKTTNALDSMDALVVAAPAVGGDSRLTPREAAIIGWLATDGHVGPYEGSFDEDGEFPDYFRASIFQSKEPQRSEIRALLGSDASERKTAAGSRTFPGHETASPTLERSQFQVKPGFARALFAKAELRSWGDLTPLVIRLSVAARSAMFHAMMAGDGHHTAGGQELFGKKRKPGVMEAFEVLATLQGIALGALQTKNCGDVPFRTLRKSPHTWARCLKRENGEPRPVWCPTTPLGTWVARWEGTITVTGNSDCLKRCAAMVGVARYLYGCGHPAYADGEFAGFRGHAGNGHGGGHASPPPRRDDRPPASNGGAQPQRGAGPQQGNGGGAQRGGYDNNKPPKVSRGLFPWIKSLEESHPGFKVLDAVNSKAKASGFPYKLAEFDDDQREKTIEFVLKKLADFTGTPAAAPPQAEQRAMGRDYDPASPDDPDIPF